MELDFNIAKRAKRTRHEPGAQDDDDDDDDDVKDVDA